jgi:hypothetical protein
MFLGGTFARCLQGHAGWSLNFSKGQAVTQYSDTPQLKCTQVCPARCRCKGKATMQGGLDGCKVGGTPCHVPSRKSIDLRGP